MNTKDSCIFRANWMDAAHTIQDLSLRCAFYEALLQYALTGMKMEAPAELELALGVIYSLIDIDRDKYEKKIEKRRMAGRMGGAPQGNQNARKYDEQSNQANQANACFDNQNQSNQSNQANQAVTDTDTDTDTDTVTVKDNDFNNPPIPPAGGGNRFMKEFLNYAGKVKNAMDSAPVAIRKAGYEKQYAWRASELQPGYELELSAALRNAQNATDVQNAIKAVNARFTPLAEFQMFRVAYEYSRLRTQQQRTAFLDELKRSQTETDIFKTLADKAEYINQGNKVSSLTAFFRARMG